MPDGSALNHPVAAAGLGALGDHGRTEQLPHRRDLRSGLLVRVAPLVHVQRNLELLAVAELRRVRGGALPDHGEPSAAGLELGAVAVQLHRVRAAEGSAVVPKPDEHGRPVLPQRAEPDVVAIEVLDHEIGQAARVLGRPHLLAAQRSAEDPWHRGSVQIR